jgi:hypothetical protein
MSHSTTEPTGSAAPGSPPPADASVAEIEADIAATRDRLADSVDALADKVNVKARAQEKVELTKEQAKEKLDLARTKGEDLLGQARQASRPAQLAIASVPLAVIVLLIVRAVRGRRS